MSFYAREVAPETHDAPTLESGRAPVAASAKTLTPGIAPDRKETEPENPTTGTLMCHTDDVTVIYMSLQEVADHLGVSRNSAAKYRLPEPDVIVGSGINAPRGWSVATIDEWNANRPGKGWRAGSKGAAK